MILLLAMAAQAQPHYAFLEGTWKLEGREQYEKWERDDSGSFSGSGYRVVEGEVRITEVLVIRESDGQVIYEATVKGQNDGKAVAFVLNVNEKAKLSFENEGHDFPKKIQYVKVSDTEVLVSVKGENERGFSYKMTLQ